MDLSSYENLQIKPTHKIKSNLIIEEWENILKIKLSLALKTTTQSTIISKLSSYERKNRTKSALWEFDNIIRSIHILCYIDDIQYRQNIQKALNRGESYHKLRRAVSYANGGKLRVRTELAQQIYNECGRLLANNIILYNTRLLSKLLELKEKDSKATEIEQIKYISPIAWQHINMYGRYEFAKISPIKTLEEILASFNLSQFKI